MDEAKRVLDAWSSDLTSCGGGWSLVKSHKRSSNSKRGPQHDLLCHRHYKRGPGGKIRQSSSLGTSCPMKMKSEKSTIGWLVLRGQFHHNHNLITTIGEANTMSSIRKLPAELEIIGKKLSKAGFSPCQILRFLNSEARCRSISSSWVYMDVYSHFKPSTSERMLDASNLIESFRRMEKDQGIFWSCQMDFSGCLTRVFIVLPNSIKSFFG